MKRLYYLHHFSKLRERTVAEIAATLRLGGPGAEIAVKTHQFTTWTGRFDQHPLGITSLDAVRERRDQFAAGGIKMHAWCVPMGLDFAAEADHTARVADLLGGEIEYVPCEAGMTGAIERSLELAADIECSFIPQQFENTANPCFHELTTGREIVEQMKGRIDAVVIGAGTSGTFCGVSRAVRKQHPNALCVLVEPEGSIYGGGPPGPKKVEGIGQKDFIPSIFDASLADEIMMVMDDDVCAALKKIARLEGLLGGWSTGAAAAASYKIAERLGPGKRVITVFPDGAERYRSQGIFDS